MRISIITDSYGGERMHKQLVEVSKEETYPELIKKKLEAQGHEVECDYAAYRKITDLPTVLEKKNKADIYIFQAGVVDAYPRTLSHLYTVSQHFFAKLIRRIIRLNRAFFIRYVYNKPWSSELEIQKAIEKICTTYQEKLIWVNIAPVNAYQERETPGANQAIKNTNALLSKIINKYPHCIELNIFDLLMKTNKYESYLHPVDSHLNKAGNIFYADEILNTIHSINR